MIVGMGRAIDCMSGLWMNLGDSPESLTSGEAATGSLASDARDTAHQTKSPCTLGLSKGRQMVPPLPIQDATSPWP